MLLATVFPESPAGEGFPFSCLGVWGEGSRASLAPRRRQRSRQRGVRFFWRNRVPMQRGEILRRHASLLRALPCYVFQYMALLNHRFNRLASLALSRFVFRYFGAVRSMS